MGVTMRLSRGGRALFLGAVTTVALWGIATPASAATVDPGGSDVALEVTKDLACSVGRSGQAPAFRCATLVALNGTLYGPVAAAGAPSGLTITPYKQVSQSGPSGAGTVTDPFRITTIVELGDTGVRIVETDRLVAGEGRIETDYRLRTSTTAASVVLFRVGDCDGSGTGSRDATSKLVTCTNGTGQVLLQPTSPNGHSAMAANSTIWSTANAKSEFADSCTCATVLDHGLGLSWSKVLTTGETVGAAAMTQLTSDTTLPLLSEATAPRFLSHAFAAEQYDITVRNLSGTARTLNSLNVVLPTGARFMTGTVTGDVTGDPSISSRTLTWPGPIAVPAGATMAFSFKARTPDDPGLVTIDVTASSDGTLVSPSRYAAVMQIGGPSSSQTFTSSTDASTTTTSETSSTESTSSTTSESTSSTSPTSSVPTSPTSSTSSTTSSYTSRDSSTTTTTTVSKESTTTTTVPDTTPDTTPTTTTSMCTSSMPSTSVSNPSTSVPPCYPPCTPGSSMPPGMPPAPGCTPPPPCYENPNMPATTPPGGCVPVCASNPTMPAGTAPNDCNPICVQNPNTPAAAMPAGCAPTAKAPSKPVFTGSRPLPLTILGLVSLGLGVTLAHRNRPRHRRPWWSTH